MREGDFRIRGREISRVEGLSDAVFGFAITLLAISLEVPKTSGEVLHALRGTGAFAVTFLMLFSLWRLQYTYFRRYGLEDRKVVVLTAVLLFVLLLFIYPLKFIMATFTQKLLGEVGFPDPGFHRSVVLPDSDIPPLFAAFGFGLAAVFFVFGAMYRHAYSLRDELKLDAVERFDTLEFIRGSAIVMGTGLAIGASYLLAAVIPSAAEAFQSGGAGIVIVAAGTVLWRRRTHSSRREAVLRKAAIHGASPDPAHA